MPFVAGVTVHVALVASLQVPALHVNVADPEWQEAAFVRVTLLSDLVLVAVAEQPLGQFSVCPGQSQGGPTQDSVCRSAGLVSSGQALLPHWQVTVRVRIL